MWHKGKRNVFRQILSGDFLEAQNYHSGGQSGHLETKVSILELLLTIVNLRVASLKVKFTIVKIKPISLKLKSAILQQKRPSRSILTVSASNFPK